jgi:hypothetical protein
MLAPRYPLSGLRLARDNLFFYTVTVYEVRAPRVSRVLSWCSSLDSMSTFQTGIHQEYVM